MNSLDVAVSPACHLEQYKTTDTVSINFIE
jgi:hypothetical protein